jgi:hypothetical protein
MGALLFQDLCKAALPEAGRCPVMLWHQVVKDLLLSRGRAWAHLCTLTNLPLSARPSTGEGTQSGENGTSVLLHDNTAHDRGGIMQS